MNTAKSRLLFDEVKKIIPLGSQTFTKSYLQYVEGGPLFIERGNGSHVWDVDGNEYIDMVCGLLPVILGHNYEPVNRAIAEQLERGISFSLPSPLEYEVAKKLQQLIPCAEMVRFGKNGSDATAGAIRLARAVTKRSRVAVCGYHGWQDWYIGVNPRNEGVPEEVKKLTHKFTYNDSGSLHNLLNQYPGEFAAVIMEPMHSVEPKPTFLQEVKELAHQHGALFIFDEIVTGFRWHLGGAQTYYNVIPDLATFGKSMANGMPISVLVGKEEYMKKLEDIFFSFTFGGECLSLAASLATIKELEEKNVIAALWQMGERIEQPLRELLKVNNLEQFITLAGVPSMQILEFSDANGYSAMEIKSFIQQDMLEKGILWIGCHNWSFSHSVEDQDRLLVVYQEVLPKLRAALDAGNLKEQLRYKPIRGNYNVRKV